MFERPALVLPVMYNSSHPDINCITAETVSFFIFFYFFLRLAVVQVFALGVLVLMCARYTGLCILFKVSVLFSLAARV